jgi:MFS family permease
VRSSEALDRRRRARDGADACLGIELLPPAILADPIAQGLGLSRTTVFGLFSGALLLSAVLGPSVGRAIDNRGGRGVLALSNLVLAAGLVLLGVAQGFYILALAWSVLGVGMAMGLYDPAFATLTGLYGRAARWRSSPSCSPVPGL